MFAENLQEIQVATAERSIDLDVHIPWQSYVPTEEPFESAYHCQVFGHSQRAYHRLNSLHYLSLVRME
jgi:hypothetical protein